MFSESSVRRISQGRKAYSFNLWNLCSAWKRLQVLNQVLDELILDIGDFSFVINGEKRYVHSVLTHFHVKRQDTCAAAFAFSLVGDGHSDLSYTVAEVITHEGISHDVFSPDIDIVSQRMIFLKRLNCLLNSGPSSMFTSISSSPHPVLSRNHRCFEAYGPPVG